MVKVKHYNVLEFSGGIYIIGFILFYFLSAFLFFNVWGNIFVSFMGLGLIYYFFNMSKFKENYYHGIQISPENDEISWYDWFFFKKSIPLSKLQNASSETEIKNTTRYDKDRREWQKSTSETFYIVLDTDEKEYKILVFNSFTIRNFFNKLNKVLEEL